MNVIKSYRLKVVDLKWKQSGIAFFLDGYQVKAHALLLFTNKNDESESQKTICVSRISTTCCFETVNNSRQGHVFFVFVYCITEKRFGCGKSVVHASLLKANSIKKVSYFYILLTGATNVGSVQVYIDEDLKTNKWRGLSVGSNKDKDFDELRLKKDISLKKGELVGQFNMGSTIVLVFEAPNTFK